MPSEWSGSEPLQRVADILDALRRLQQYVGGTSRDAFLSDEMRRDATIRVLEVISEATHHLHIHAPEYAERYPDVDFRRIADAGNIYRHRYGFVDDTIVWNTVHGADIAAIRRMIRAEIPDPYLAILGEDDE